MAKVLIVYGSTEGQTEKIARAIEKTLTQNGHNVDLCSASEAPEENTLSAYDGIVVGSSVHMHQFHKALGPWVRKEVGLLNEKHTAFFSVCLGILQNNPNVQAEERKIVEDFFKVTRWHPAQNTIFAGALTYSKYGWFKRQFMKAISKRAGGETDTSRDYEYTDWNAVKSFAQTFSDSLMSSSQTVAV